MPGPRFTSVESRAVESAEALHPDAKRPRHAAVSAPGVPRTPIDDARARTGRDTAVLATTAFAAAASNLAAVHAMGWASSTLGTPATLLNMALSGLSAIVDGTVAVYLAACLLVVQRPNLLAGLLSVVLATAPVAFSAAKLAVFGSPGFFGDVLLLGDLAAATDGTRVAIAGGLAIAAAVALASNLRPVRTWRALLGLSPLLVVGAAAITAQHSPILAVRLAALLPAKVSDYPENGHVLNALTELAASIDRRHGQEAARAYGHPPVLALDSVHVLPLERRNVHLIVVESLIDPAWLTGFAFSPEPLGPLFARWRDGGGSTAVTPVFGNRSTNTEFETLCGLPAAVGPSDVVFRLIPAGSELPCLPRLLAAQGFRTMATKGNSPGFYNAGAAFAAAGFQERTFGADMDTADRDGIWLAADTTLRQAEDRMSSQASGRGDAPILNFVVVIAGHYPYDRDKSRRPDRVSVTPADSLVGDYANAAYYNAAAVEGFVHRITASDPRALIVVLGDHQPLLGPNYKGYRNGGRLPPVDDLPPLHKATMFETPLLVLDAGEVVPVGRLPAFLLPEVILDRLSGGEHCRRNACAHQEGWRLRPFRDYAIEVEAHGRGERLCLTQREPGTASSCAAAIERSRAWEAALFQALGPPPRTALSNGG